MLRKKLSVLLLAVVLAASTFAGCSSSNAGTSEDAKTVVSTDKEKTSADEATSKDKKFRVAYSAKNQDNPFQQAFAKAMLEQGEALGWEVTVLEAKNKIENEQTNMETLIAQKYDLIFVNVVDNLAGATMCKRAKDAGIPVIGVDSNIDSSGEVVTTVLCDNLGGGFEVGKYLATQYGADEEIKAGMISGNKGNTAAQERRCGVFAGVIAARTGMDQESAYKAAYEFDDQITAKGKASYPEAKFTIVGQGWGAWTTDKGLTAAEDIITANADMNCMIAENDSMLIGAMKALENSGMLSKVQLFASHDGQKEAMELIKDGTQYKATGLNIPSAVVAKAYEVAQKVLLEGNTDGFEALTKTEAVAITKENVDKYYDPDSIF